MDNLFDGEEHKKWGYENEEEEENEMKESWIEKIEWIVVEKNK